MIHKPQSMASQLNVAYEAGRSEGKREATEEMRRLEAEVNAGKRVRDELCKKLTAHVATVKRLEAIHAGWLKENSPGGWIDGLRVANLELLEALKEFDALIKHRYTGTREAMSDLTYAAKRGAALIKKHGG